MKHLLVRLITILLTFSIGVSASMLFKESSQSKADSLPVAKMSVTSCGGAIVISIPGDDEFYIGNDRIFLHEIPNKLRDQLTNRVSDEREVLIKAEPNIRYGTIVSVIDKINEAEVLNIGLVSTKKRARITTAKSLAPPYQLPTN